MMTIIQWPANAIDDAATDLAAPTTTFLQDLYLLESKEDAETGTSLTRTPYSLQVITAGALDASKISGLLTGIGGVGGAAATAWAAYQAEDVAVRVTLIGAVAVILAAAFLAVALIVRSDVRSRSDATVAQYAARASVAERFLTLAARAQTPPAATSSQPVASSNGVAPATDVCGLLSSVAAFSTAIKPEGGELERVIGVRRHASGLQVRVASGGWVSVNDVEQFTSL
jgi:hypothetical protein